MKTISVSLWILAAAVVVAGLYWFGDILAPFALAIFLWLVIDAFARALHERIAFFPRWAALPLAILIVLAGAAGIVMVIVDSAAEFAARAPDYQARIAEIVAMIYDRLGLEDPPSLRQLMEAAGPGRFLGAVAAAFQGLLSQSLFVLIYIAFLFAAQASFPRKMDALFPEPDDRMRAGAALEAINRSVQDYLRVQTILGVIAAVATYLTLVVIGLDNALFWSFLIFLLSYVPTIGPIVSTILPTLFALVQFSSLWMVGAVFAGVGFWQFIAGNVLQPRMQGESLNLSTLVVLLSLAIWGELWGIIGMFLAAPLTVMLMIIFAQFASTRSIAVLLSADGRPGGTTRSRVTPAM